MPVKRWNFRRVKRNDCIALKNKFEKTSPDVKTPSKTFSMPSESSQKNYSTRANANYFKAKKKDSVVIVALIAANDSLALRPYLKAAETFFLFISIFILLTRRKATEALIHRVSNYPDLLPEIPKYCCPLVILIEI